MTQPSITIQDIEAATRRARAERATAFAALLSGAGRGLRRAVAALLPPPQRNAIPAARGAHQAAGG